MGAYDGWKMNQLQAAASQRGLSAGGSKEELTARLEAHDGMLADDSDLLGAVDDDGLVAATTRVAAPTPPPPPPPAPPAPAEPEPLTVPAERPRYYRTTFPCHNELSTGTHEENRHRAYQQAILEGYIPRGGLAGVSRVGFDTVNGIRHAVYHVLLQR